MRVLSIRTGRERDDIESGRAILAEAMKHPSKVVAVIRGDGPEVTRVADKAAARSDPFPWREVIWIMDSRIFQPGEEDRLFAGHAKACGVVLDFAGRPRAWIEPSAQMFDVDDAFLEAEHR